MAEGCDGHIRPPWQTPHLRAGRPGSMVVGPGVERPKHGQVLHMLGQHIRSCCQHQNAVHAEGVERKQMLGECRAE